MKSNLEELLNDKDVDFTQHSLTSKLYAW